MKPLLKAAPGEPVIAELAAEAALNAGNAGFALETLKPVSAAHPDDWQSTALLTRACAESGDAVGRDAGIARMMDLHRRGLTPSRMSRYIVEKVKSGENMLVLWTSLEPWGPYKVYNFGQLFDNAGRLVMRITIESSDGDQPLFAEAHPWEAKQGIREFSLDAYRETGLNPDGKKTQTHYTFAFFIGQPSYETVREQFLKVADGTAKPRSSRSGIPMN